jgi:hypothetical protein
MQRSLNPVYPLDEAIEILKSPAPPTHIYILTTNRSEHDLVMKLAKGLNYLPASTVWANVTELLKRGGGQ